MQPRKIAVFVGSLRKESYCRKMAKLFMEIAPESLALTILEIDGLAILQPGPRREYARGMDRISKQDQER